MARCFILLLLFFSFLPLSYAVFPKEIAKKVEQEKQNSAAEKTDHKEKSLYLHLQFTKESFKDMFRFIVKIRNRDGQVSALISGSLSNKTHTMIMNYNEMGEPSPILVRLLILDLNRLILGPLIYDKEVFAEVKLSQETAQILKAGNPEDEALVKLNRMLLEDAYPDEIIPLKRDMGGFFAKARPIVVDVPMADYNQRVLDLYAGKTFTEPLIPKREGEENKPKPVPVQKPLRKEPGSATWFWIVGGAGLLALFWTLKQFGSHTS